MLGFPLSFWVLLLIAGAIYLGVAQRVLDRLYLNERTTLVLILAMLIGSFFDFPLIPGRNALALNVGGALIPLGIGIYVLARAGTGRERKRAFGTAVITALVLLGLNFFVFAGDPWHNATDFLDLLFIYPLVAGGVAYLLGRSRRAAFIGAVFGVLMADLGNYFLLLARGIRGVTVLGGAGILDVLVLAAIFAVLLAEVVGEARERLQGGPLREGRPKELLEGLQEKNREE